MINALGKYSVKLRGVPSGRCPPPDTPPRHRRVRFSPGSRRRIDDRDRRAVLGAGFGGLELCTLLPNFASTTNPRVILCLLL